MHSDRILLVERCVTKVVEVMDEDNTADTPCSMLLDRLECLLKSNMDEAKEPKMQQLERHLMTTMKV